MAASSSSHQDRRYPTDRFEYIHGIPNHTDFISKRLPKEWLPISGEIDQDGFERPVFRKIPDPTNDQGEAFFQSDMTSRINGLIEYEKAQGYTPRGHGAEAARKPKRNKHVRMYDICIIINTHGEMKKSSRGNVREGLDALSSLGEHGSISQRKPTLIHQGIPPEYPDAKVTLITASKPGVCNFERPKQQTAATQTQILSTATFDQFVEKGETLYRQVDLKALVAYLREQKKIYIKKNSKKFQELYSEWPDFVRDDGYYLSENVWFDKNYFPDETFGTRIEVVFDSKHNFDRNPVKTGPKDFFDELLAHLKRNTETRSGGSVRVTLNEIIHFLLELNYDKMLIVDTSCTALDDEEEFTPRDVRGLGRKAFLSAFSGGSKTKRHHRKRSRRSQTRYKLRRRN